jgi:hypothetical protein
MGVSHKIKVIKWILDSPFPTTMNVIPGLSILSFLSRQISSIAPSRAVKKVRNRRCDWSLGMWHDNLFESSRVWSGRCETEGATISRDGVMVELHKMMMLLSTMSGGGVYSAGGSLVILPSLCTPPKPWRHRRTQTRILSCSSKSY